MMARAVAVCINLMARAIDKLEPHMLEAMTENQKLKEQVQQLSDELFVTGVALNETKLVVQQKEEQLSDTLEALEVSKKHCSRASHTINQPKKDLTPSTVAAERLNAMAEIKRLKKDNEALMCQFLEIRGAVCGIMPAVDAAIKSSVDGACPRLLESVNPKTLSYLRFVYNITDQQSKPGL